MPQNLFNNNKQTRSPAATGFLPPLAERLRPQTLDELVGQQELVGEGKPLRELILQDELPSFILWGPPGVGKTSIARVIARVTRAHFVALSAVEAGLKELREILQVAEERRQATGQHTILFIDEVHRWNKAQQDALLPYVEHNKITLIGATTENPSFEINSALLSRAKVFVLEPLGHEDIKSILKRALSDKQHGIKDNVEVGEQELDELCRVSGGDARIGLNTLEIAVQFTKPQNGKKILTKEALTQVLKKGHLRYDRAGDQHYNIISALHKSLRGSDADAALYWLGRMLEAGEDPLYVARRLVRFASEDIGLADPQALVQAISVYQAAHYLGMPEANINLAQAVAYLARAPKSNKLYTAYQEVQMDVNNLPPYEVPVHLRNAPTKLMKDLGYGKDYKYPPSCEAGNPDYEASVNQEYLPKELKGKKYLK